ncbi:hypothetical protein [Pendulispora albinea]|uniref:Amidinotransferase n=1 Tax=Pendulispora albinea TaxID=2741071 RepID=A0ABZ2MA18_9BACT
MGTESLPVCSHNEWDTVEEVIVGTALGACIPEWHVTLKATLPERYWSFFKEHGGQPFPDEIVRAAERDLDGLAKILEAEGVRVRRPEPMRQARGFASPHWRSRGGLYAAMPRDCLLVVGDEILEVPMAWRCRHFETQAFRPLLKEYFLRGAKWTAAPKPMLGDALYDEGFHESAKNGVASVLTEIEPVFDAADFLRCGKDIVYFRSHTTNALGVEWLSRHLGSAYRFHELECDDTHRMHIDTTFLPLRPGLLMVNPERVRTIPRLFRSWDILEAPPGCTPDDVPLYFSSKWLNMNVFMLDEERVLVAAHEKPLIAALRNRGLAPIPVPFLSFYPLGGSIHCATLDVVRRGALKSYF